MTYVPFYMRSYTAADVEEAERDLALLEQALDEEEDPAWRDMLRDQIKMDAEWLEQMRAAVFPPLAYVLPLGLPAPGPRWEGVR